MRRGRRRGRLGESGQSTVEFAIVTFALLSMVVALGALWGLAHEGGLLELGVDAASHTLADGVDVGALQDIALF